MSLIGEPPVSLLRNHGAASLRLCLRLYWAVSALEDCSWRSFLDGCDKSKGIVLACDSFVYAGSVNLFRFRQLPGFAIGPENSFSGPRLASRLVQYRNCDYSKG